MRHTADSHRDLGDLEFADLESVISTSGLIRRPKQPPDYESENRALVALVEVMTAFPDDICRTWWTRHCGCARQFYCHARSGAGRQEARS
jgi:hypothetical protein